MTKPVTISATMFSTMPSTVFSTMLSTMLLMLSTVTLTACGAEQKPATTPAQVDKADKTDVDKATNTATNNIGKTDIGKTLYESNCEVCHAQGIAYAPKLADKAAWKPRIARGKEALYISVLHGTGGMPARGTADDASDEDIKAAVDYMIANSQ